MGDRPDPSGLGCHESGETREEARENVLDALQLLLRREPEADAGEAESVELTVVR